jgi:hypothetical protein
VFSGISYPLGRILLPTPKPARRILRPEELQGQFIIYFNTLSKIKTRRRRRKFESCQKEQEAIFRIVTKLQGFKCGKQTGRRIRPVNCR